MTYEESIARLEYILRQLEGGQGNIADALSQYEEGVTLIKNCHQILDTAKQKIEILRNMGTAKESVSEWNETFGT